MRTLIHPGPIFGDHAKPLQLHLQTTDLLEQFGLLGQKLLFDPTLFASGEQSAGAFQQLPLTLAHYDRVNRVISGVLLD